MKNKLNMDFIQKYMMVIALVLIWVIFSFLTDGIFLNSRNISNLFTQSVFISLLAIGMVMVIILAEIDLSVGSIVGFTGGISAIMVVWNSFNPIITIIVTLALGALIGLWHGWWVASRKLPSFIVTLAGLLIFRGLLIGALKGQTLGPMPEFFQTFGKGFLPPWFAVVVGVAGLLVIMFIQFKSRREKLKYKFEVPSIKVEIGKIILTIGIIGFFTYHFYNYRGFPVGLFVLLFFILFFTYITNNTVFGRSIYSIGGNREAARLSGINIKKLTMGVFVINGMMAAIAGIYLTSRLNAASVASGTSAELDAIAAAVIGGTSLMGGVGTIVGAVIGAVVMSSLDNGMSLMNVPMFWQQVVKGLVLVLAVWFDIASKRKGAKA